MRLQDLTPEHVGLLQWQRIGVESLLVLKMREAYKDRQRIWRVSRRIRIDNKKQVEMCTEHRDREYVDEICNYWDRHDPNAFYYVTHDKTKLYAPRDSLKILGLPEGFNWDFVWPDYWPTH